MICLITAIIGLLLYLIDNYFFETGLSRIGKIGFGLLSLLPVVGACSMIMLFIFQCVGSDPDNDDPDLIEAKINDTELNRWLFNTTDWPEKNK